LARQPQNHRLAFSFCRHKNDFVAIKRPGSRNFKKRRPDFKVCPDENDFRHDASVSMTLKAVFALMETIGSTMKTIGGRTPTIGRRTKTATLSCL